MCRLSYKKPTYLHRKILIKPMIKFRVKGNKLLLRKLMNILSFCIGEYQRFMLFCVIA